MAGRHGLGEWDRLERYARQRGVEHPEQVTAAQRRRLRKAANRTLGEIERAARQQSPDRPGPGVEEPTEPDMPPGGHGGSDMFTCGQCGRTLVKGWSDEEQKAEADAAFPDLDPADAVVVCETCWWEMRRALPDLDALYRPAVDDS